MSIKITERIQIVLRGNITDFIPISEVTVNREVFEVIRKAEEAGKKVELIELEITGTTLFGIPIKVI